MVALWGNLTMPVVTIDRTLPGLPFPMVAMDNVLGTRLAMDPALAGAPPYRLCLLAGGGVQQPSERLQGYARRWNRKESHSIQR